MLKIGTVFRICYNMIRFKILHIKYKSHFLYSGFNFASPITTILVGKGYLKLNGKIMIEKGCYLSTSSGGRMEIGENTFFNRNCYIACRDRIIIGRDCIFAPYVSVYDHNHKFTKEKVYKNTYSSGSIFIGDGCWIGTGVTILKNTIIGEGSVIGANTVISGVIPPHSLVTSNRENYIIPLEDRDA